MREMKDSGVEWIGEIPEQWRLAKIGNLYQITLGKMLETKQSDDGYSLENYLCSANIKWKAVDTSINKKMWFSEAERIQYLLKEGDVLITEGGSAGTACLYNGEFSPCYIQNSVLRCSANEIDNKYLYYWMHVVYHGGYIDSICNKATIQHYTKDKLQHTPIICLPKEDKIRIIRYLDEKCTRIDGVIEKQQAAIEKLKEYKLSIITEATTQGIRENTLYKDSNIKWLNRIPVNWDVYSLGKISTSIRNGYVGPTRDIFVEEGGIPYIQSLHVKDGKINLQNNEYNVSEEWGKKHPKVSEGQLLIVQTGDIGQVGLVSKEMEGYNCHALIITSLDKKYVIPEYVAYYLRGSIGKELMLDTRTGALLPHLNSGKIKNTSVVIPPIQEQSEIVDFLNLKCGLIEKAILHKMEIIDKLEAYKKSLIYEIVTGKREV